MSENEIETASTTDSRNSQAARSEIAFRSSGKFFNENRQDKSSEWSVEGENRFIHWLTLSSSSTSRIYERCERMKKIEHNLQTFLSWFQRIRDLIIDRDFKVVRTRRTIITPLEAESFYSDHKEKFFYNRLLTFMCSGPSDIHILAGHEAIIRWRKLMGPTKVYQAQFEAPDTIRGMYGLSDTRNATHGSGSVAL